MDVDEGSDQNLGIESRWASQHGRLKETFANMRYVHVPKFHVLVPLFFNGAHNIANEIRIALFTLYSTKTSCQQTSAFSCQLLC